MDEAYGVGITQDTAGNARQSRVGRDLLRRGKWLAESRKGNRESKQTGKVHRWMIGHPARISSVR